MKRFLLALLLILAAPVFAGPYTVGLQTPVYTNSHPKGAPNTAPAYAYEAPDVASNFTVATWEHITSTGTGPAAGQFDNPTTTNESKARFDCNVAFENSTDPIIFPGIANGSPHKHTFFGNTAAASNTQNVTYASLRASGNSTCYGGPINRTLYWEPSIEKLLPSGAIATVKPKNIVTYYESGSGVGTAGDIESDPNEVTRWPRGIDMVFGFNMGDPTDSRVTKIRDDLNAIQPGRYSTVSSFYGGYRGWHCVVPASGNGSIAGQSPVPGSDFQPYLRNADGTATLNCSPNTEIQFENASYPCWDGVNLTSPDGRKHFMPYLKDNFTGKFVCPDNWYRVTRFRVKVQFNQSGQSDYTSWWASSDRMVGMTQFNNAASIHSDLIPAWDYGTAASPGAFLEFINHCGGVNIVMSGTTMASDPHECGFGRISSTKQLWVTEASPDGSQPSPVVTLSPDQSGTNRYFPLTGATGDFTIQHPHSMNDNIPMPANDNQTQLAGAAPVSFNLRSGSR